MDMKIVMHEGSVTVSSSNFSAEEYATGLNNQRVLVTAFGDLIISKNAIRMIIPAIDEPNPTVTVHTIDNQQIPLNAGEYATADMVAKFNDPTVLMLAIGPAVINKNQIKMIVPVVQAS